MSDSVNATLPNAEVLIQNLSDQLLPLLKPNTALVGIHSGGALILDYLLDSLAAPIAKHAIEYGSLDISMHRDDYATRGLSASIKPTKIAFNIQDKHIILIDDIFNTGRTARAAMNELFDFGRPASITMATLVNRGGQELPIQPQIVAHEMTLDSNYRLALFQADDGTLVIKSAIKPLPTETENDA